jgi:hypothetical protein
MSANTYQKSLVRENSSAVAYEALTFTAGEYVFTQFDNILMRSIRF